MAKVTYKQQFNDQLTYDMSLVRDTETIEKYIGVYNNLFLHKKTENGQETFVIRPTLSVDRSYGNTHIPYKVAETCYINHDIAGFCKPPRFLRWYSSEQEAREAFDKAVILLELYSSMKESTLLIEVAFNWNQHRYGFHVYSLRSGFGDSVRNDFEKIGEAFCYEPKLSERLSSLLGRNIDDFRKDVLCIELNFKTNLVQDSDLI